MTPGKREGVFTLEGNSNNSCLSLNSQDMFETVVSDMLKRDRSKFCGGEPLTDKGNQKQMVKMLALIFIPVLLLWSLALKALSDDIAERQNIEATLNCVEITMEIGRLVHRLQKERDLSTLFNTALGPSTKSFLTEEYAETDKHIMALSSWPVNLGGKTSADFATKESLMTSLSDHRAKLGLKGEDYKVNLKYYTSVIDVFVSWIRDSVKSSKYGVLWKSLVAYVKLITTRNAIGFERTLGTTFFIKGKFAQSEDYQTYLRKYFESKSAFRSAVSLSNIVTFISENDIKLKQKNISDAFILIKNQIYYNGSTEIEPSPFQAEMWYDAMTLYLDIVVDQQQTVVKRITLLLQLNNSTIFKKVAVSSTLLVFVVILSLLVFKGVQSISSDIQRFAITLVDKTKELTNEQKKSESLIYQILPRPVAKSLKQGSKVKGEYFKEATMFFSDIVGFSQITVEVSPMGVVTLLNNLYNFMDSVLDRFDVYKVETVCSTYMIASGLPRRNDDKHAPEIANLALELITLLKKHVGFLSDRVISLRIGINTGPIVAGVVGCKMPRYCLFGDTVNTTSRLQTTSLANRIHISASTRTGLLKQGGYAIMSRGGVLLKGKGTVMTYWLLARTVSLPVLKEVFFDAQNIPGMINYGSCSPNMQGE